jgi:molybdopterin synthase sulfur carrier subunit
MPFPQRAILIACDGGEAMARVVLASMLTRWLPAEVADGAGEVALDLPAATVGAALDALFDRHPGLRGYVVDERGALRRHVALFVDGDALQPKSDLARPLRADSELYVMQALSGG